MKLRPAGWNPRKKRAQRRLGPGGAGQGVEIDGQPFRVGVEGGFDDCPWVGTHGYSKAIPSGFGRRPGRKEASAMGHPALREPTLRPPALRGGVRLARHSRIR